MQNFGKMTWLGVLLGLLSLAASARLVAMRVEVEPVAAVDDRTAMRVVVTVAPEDRQRMGRDVWLSAELRSNDRVVERTAQAVRLQRDGTLQLDVAWPPGSYELRVDVQNADGKATGFWRRAVTVPALEVPPPTPQSAETDKPVAAAPAAVASSGTVATAEDAISDDEGGAATPHATGPDDPSEPEVKAADEAVPSASRPESEQVSAVSAVSAETATQAAPAAGAEAVAEAPAPKVGQPDQQAVEPPPDVGEPNPKLELWSDRAPGLKDLTVTVTQRSRPVAGLNRGDFVVKVGGRDTVIEAFGRAGESPVFLAIAMQIGSMPLDDQSLIRDHLGRLALHATGAGGQVAVIAGSAGEQVEWTASPMAVRAGLASVHDDGSGSPAQLLTNALGAIRDRSGRRFVVLVTDGGAEDREAWKGALTQAGSSTVPVLVVAFRGDRLSERTRRNLEKAASVSGGQRHVLTGTGLLRMVSEYYGELLDSSYVLRLRLPALSKPLKLKLGTVGGDRTTVVNHSELVD